MQIEIDPGILQEAKIFVQNYIAQDNRMTAWPYAYVLQEKKLVLVPIGSGEETYYRHPDTDFNFTEDQIPELRKTLEMPELDISQCYSIGDGEIVWEDVQWFFTEAGLNEHLRNNHWNYGETRTYVKHFHRNGEAELILRAMFQFAGVNYEEYSR